MIATFWNTVINDTKETVKQNYLRVTFCIRKLLDPVTTYLAFFICAGFLHLTCTELPCLI